MRYPDHRIGCSREKRCMRWCCRAPGAPLQMQERPDPSTRRRRNSRQVSGVWGLPDRPSCGRCGASRHQISCCSGHEIVGRVDLVGSNVTTHRIGDRGRNPLAGIYLRRLPVLQGGHGKFCVTARFSPAIRGTAASPPTPLPMHATLSRSARTATMFRSRRCCAPA